MMSKQFGATLLAVLLFVALSYVGCRVDLYVHGVDYKMMGIEDE